MIISASTASSFQKLGIDGAFSMFANAGFDAVDFGFDIDCPLWKVKNGDRTSIFFSDTDEIVKHYAVHKESAVKHGIEIYQAHAPFPSYIHEYPETNEFALEAVKKCFPILKMMECKYLVVHPCFGNYAERLEPEDEWKLNIEFYSALIEQAQKYDVIVCLENMFTANRGKVYEAICSDPNEAASYIDELNRIAGEERFAFCYDSGHALLLGRDPYLALKPLGKRVKLLHIHDNDGKDDQHVSPFMGRLDWDRLIKGLKAIKYEGCMNLEVGNLCAWYPTELIPDAYKLAAACARYLVDKVEK